MPKPSGLAQLEPVDTENLHQRVYVQLREAIMSGKFRPGEVLTLRALAAALGTSIIPARDALLRLVTERALESSRRSVRVPVMELDELRDVERLRILIEGEAASLAAERSTKEDIHQIELAAARVEKAYRANKFDSFISANQEFHFTVYQAAHNDLLQSIIEKLWLQIGPYLGFLVESKKGTELSDFIDMEPHERLIAAIKSRDGEGARAALAADLQDSTDVYYPYRKDAAILSA